MSSEIDVVPETLEQEGRDLAMTEVLTEGNPEVFVARLEKMAELAPRRRQAIELILVSQTYPQDWTIQGKKACLGSAGAERIGRCFPIRHTEVKFVKEEFEDGLGKGYRFVFSGKASMNGMEVYVQGNYSSRDKFLGYEHGDWKATEDINEGSIRNAAYHIFCGNAVKALLGLRGIPQEEYTRIMGTTGRDAGKSSTVQRGKGTRGGSRATDDDKANQKALCEACIAIVDAGMTAQKDAEGEWGLYPVSKSDDREPLDIAAAICVDLSSFEGDKGPVPGKPASKLTGKWLGTTLGRARKLVESL